MATNTIGSFMKSVFPSYINKSGDVFKALLTDGSGKGTLEAMWEKIESERKEWRGTGNIYDQTGEELEKTLALVSVLARSLNDTEAEHLEKIKLLFIRGDNATWGSVFDIERIFKAVLKNERVWVVSNCESIEDSLLLDGDFESEGNWEISGCSYDRAARFSDSQGILFSGEGSCSQKVEIKESTPYFLHFFMQGGSLEVSVKDENGKYWVPTSDGFGVWSENENSITFQGDSEKWDAKSLMFLTDSEVKNVTITFYHSESEGDTYLDYARLFEKTGSSTFALITVSEGKYTEETAGLAGGNEDPIEGIEERSENDYTDTIYYDTRAYYERNYFYGTANSNVGSIYEKFLSIIAPAGVIWVVENLAREGDSTDKTSEDTTESGN